MSTNDAGDESGTLADLAETMDLLARPGLSVEATDGSLLIRLRLPGRDDDLLSFVATPREDDWAAHFDELVRGFNEFNDVAVAMLDGVVPSDTALAVAQDLRNRAIVENSSGWYDVLRFRYGHVENDIRRWLR
jgi:hypothetical protein